MKYYIDFEATQFDQEIISVGCINENGREFYSLVRPHSMRKMTGFITELTGITSAELRRADDADDVFEHMYDYMDKSEDVRFYCYGNCDGRFVKMTMRHVTSFKAQCMLGLIYSSLIDVSPEMSEIFKTNQTVSLYKLSDYFGARGAQNHNALSDAKLLKQICEKAEGLELEECPFPEYVIKKKPEKAGSLHEPEPVKEPHVTASFGGNTYGFSSYGKAADWIMSEMLPEKTEVTEQMKSNISNRIVRAAANGGSYHGFTWRSVKRQRKHGPEPENAPDGEADAEIG